MCPMVGKECVRVSTRQGDPATLARTNEVRHCVVQAVRGCWQDDSIMSSVQVCVGWQGVASSRGQFGPRAPGEGEDGRDGEELEALGDLPSGRLVTRPPDRRS